MGADKRKNYAGVFDSSLELGKRPALILIDFVQAYFDKSCPLYADVEDTLTHALEIRDTARSAGVPVVYTNVRYSTSLRDGGRFVQKVPALECFAEGNPMGDWPDRLEPEEDELVITKQYPSAFFGTSLAATLAANGNDSLIITGLTTSGCVRATCVDCCSHGFIPVVAEDAVGDRHESPHEANLFDMQAKYGEVAGTEHIKSWIKDLSG